MPTPVKFWDRIAERYSRRPIADEAAYQKKLEVTRHYLRPDMEVLELGCGTGSTAIKHAPFVRHIRAVDISSKMIEIARTRANGVANVTFEQASVEDLEVKEGSVDAVFTLSLLHLLNDKESAIARIKEILKPGGIFVSSTACLGDTMKWFKIVAPIGQFLGLIPTVNTFTVQELVNSLIDAGFEIDCQWQPGPGKAVFIVAKKHD
ncbi:MAG: class I SAM-dependent methyltransferase [Betaproteobacteria bacterium]|jgi:ubiquinone/menaquinone biosynthesis C-methylase UbiE|nr:MAG: class I SAM-dependent methyltransferase [Betaproteobacteria bacterium]